LFLIGFGGVSHARVEASVTAAEPSNASGAVFAVHNPMLDGSRSQDSGTLNAFSSPKICRKI
jgi:hypothetical protein